MKSIQKALAAPFALILFHLFISTQPSVLCGRTIPKIRMQPRRLLGSFASFSANQNKLSGATQDSKKAVETGLRKAPPSGSNPIQNK
ncbi:hypothetical protein SLA2020_482070 [Shorea laevis]